VFTDKLPIIRQEFGDTWIYGAASDPVKVCRYRAIARLRRQWIAQGKLSAGDSPDLALPRRLSLAVEHTWGADTKTWLDFDHYSPHDLAQVLDQPGYQTMETSWAEKRNDIAQGIAALPDTLRTEAEQCIAALKVEPPPVAGLKEYPVQRTLETEHFIVQLDPATGSICRLGCKRNGREWASIQHPLALFSYQTLSKTSHFMICVKSYREINTMLHRLSTSHRYFLEFLVFPSFQLGGLRRLPTSRFDG
jgi:hypothetical protein